MNPSATARMLSQLWFVTIAVLASLFSTSPRSCSCLSDSQSFSPSSSPLSSLSSNGSVPAPRRRRSRHPCLRRLLLVATWTFFTQLVAIADELPVYRDNVTQKLDALHRPSNSAIGRVQRALQKLSDELGIVNSTATAALQPHRPT